MSYFVEQDDLFAPYESSNIDAVIPWRPRALTHEQWPPDYRAVYAWRMQTLGTLRSDPNLLADAKEYYRSRPAEFIMHWMDTYNPRKATNKWMPFVLFSRQEEFVEFLEDLRLTNQSGLVEKCRDIGATWLACAYSVWAYAFLPEDATGWGSRKENLVDKLGDADSIFEKMRLLINRLPDVFRPSSKSAFMKLINEEMGSSITGEAGDNIGRGGRKSRFFVDEAAHIERPEMIEASLGDNTDTRVDMSSVNGLGNIFHRRREAGELWMPDHNIESGVVRVFIFDWRDHPEKDQEWYDRRKAKSEREGMQHIFAQEVDRAYDAAVENVIIPYEWVEACIDAHLNVPYLQIPPPDIWMAGQDLADEGVDKNALAIRQWIILRHIEETGSRDPGLFTRKMFDTLRVRGRKGMQIQYDCIGVGVGAKTEYNRMVEMGELDPREFEMVPWNAGSGVIRPYERVIKDDEESPRNRDFFHNFKAQAWWSVRTRIYKTFRAVKDGEVYPPDELFSISSEIPTPIRLQLMKELAQPTRGKSTASQKMLVNKKPEGTRSPNLADSVVQCYFPAPDQSSSFHVGSYSQ